MAHNRHFGSKYSHFGENGKGHDIKAFGDTSGKYVFWDASANTLHVEGTLDVTTQLVETFSFDDAEPLKFGAGEDVTIQWDGTNLIFTAAADDSLIEIGDAGATQKSFDLKWYGNAANGSDYLYFDASANLVYTNGIDLQFKDNDFLVFGTGSGGTGDVTIRWDGTDLVMQATGASAAWNIGAASHVINTTITGKLTVGVDDTGYDVQFFGATSGCSMLWDESEDQLVITGPDDAPALKLAGAGSISAGDYEGVGAAWADGGKPAFVDDQKYMLIDIGGTVYRIPLWANA